MSTNPAQTVFTVSDAAAFLGDHGIRISPSRVYQVVREGQLDAIRVGRRVYVTRRSLERLCDLEVAA